MFLTALRLLQFALFACSLLGTVAVRRGIWRPNLAASLLIGFSRLFGFMFVTSYIDWALYTILDTGGVFPVVRFPVAIIAGLAVAQGVDRRLYRPS